MYRMIQRSTLSHQTVETPGCYDVSNLWVREHNVEYDKYSDGQRRQRKAYQSQERATRIKKKRNISSNARHTPVCPRTHTATHVKHTTQSRCPTYALHATLLHTYNPTRAPRGKRHRYTSTATRQEDRNKRSGSKGIAKLDHDTQPPRNLATWPSALAMNPQ